MASPDLNAIFAPLFSGDLAKWQGLPAISASELETSLGKAAEQETVTLGAYPAERLRFSQPGGHTLLAYVRHGQVVMVEVLPPPDSSVLATLPEPTAILPQEIDVAGAYAHEYLYAEQGLLLTVAQDLKQATRHRGVGAMRHQLVRCRGIRPLSHPRALGAELYRPLDLDVKW
jgi:hypothetical protein